MADPDSVMERSLEREGTSARMRRLVTALTDELDAHMAEMDRRIVERLEQLLFDAHAYRPLGPFYPEYRVACGAVVFYDEIERDFVDEGANLEYLKSLVQDETPPQLPRRCPRPKRLERKGRDAERTAQNRRERRQQPARVFAR